MTAPVTDLADFFPTYLALLQAGDAQGLGTLYTEHAVLTSSGGPLGPSWSVGRTSIVANLTDALLEYRVDDETEPDAPYELRGRHLAARNGTFVATVTPKVGGPSVRLTVEAFEVLTFSPAIGWQYLADHARIVATTIPSHASQEASGR